MFDFFRTLINPGRVDEKDRERAVVSQISNLLQVGEFQILQLAYHEWYGEDLPTSRTDAVFTEYMMRGIVPVWARHYARKIKELEDTGRLDYKDLSYHRYDHEYVTYVPGGRKQFVKFASILGILIFGAIGLSAAITANKTGSILPPYFDDDEFKNNNKTIPLP